MFVILVILTLVVAIWGALFAIRGSLIAGCLTYLGLACCCSGNFYSLDVGVTLTLDRAFLAGLVVAFGVQWRLGRLQPKPLTVVDYAVFALIGLLGSSWRIHGEPEVMQMDPSVAQHLINGYLIPLCLYVIARQTKLTESNMTLVLGWLTMFGVYLAVTGIFEALGWWSFVFPRYIADPELGIHFGRARGPMVHSVSYGLYLNACLLAAWLWRPRLPRRWQLAVMATFPLFFAAIYFTKTRSIWLGAATGVLLMIILTLRGRVRLAALASVLAVTLVVGVTKLDAIMGLQREGTVQDTRKSTSMRGSFAYVSWKMFQDRPIMGFGFGHFASAKLPYLSDRSTDLDLESIRAYAHHNTFLSILIEVGLIGFVIFMCVLAGWNVMAWRVVKNNKAPLWAKQIGFLFLGLMGVAFWQMVGHEITFTPVDQSMIYFLAGCVVGLRVMFARQPSRVARQPAQARLNNATLGTPRY